MAEVTLTIPGTVNVSLQSKDTQSNAKDVIYWIETTGTPNFTQVGDIKKLGTCLNITDNDTDPPSFDVLVEVIGSVQTPGVDSYIFFGKENKVGMSGLTGYFAEVEMTYPANVSVNQSELFTVSSEISISSK